MCSLVLNLGICDTYVEGSDPDSMVDTKKNMKRGSLCPVSELQWGPMGPYNKRGWKFGMAETFGGKRKGIENWE